MHRTIIIIMIEKFVFCCIFVSLPSYIHDDGSLDGSNRHGIHHHIQFFSSFVHTIIQYNSIFFLFDSFFGDFHCTCNVFNYSFASFECEALCRSIRHTHQICIIERGIFSNKNVSPSLFDLASSFLLVFFSTNVFKCVERLILLLFCGRSFTSSHTMPNDFSNGIRTMNKTSRSNCKYLFIHKILELY